MNETLLSATFCEAVKAHPACASLVAVLQWRIPETKDALVLPCVTFSARDVVPIGVKAFCTGMVEMKLESQSDDETTSDTHIARANLLIAAVRDTAGTNITDAINNADPQRIRLKGFTITGGGRGTEGRRWTSSVLFRVGFAPV